MKNNTPLSSSPHINSDSLLKTSALLASAKAMLVPATQPLQVIMRHQQASLSQGQYVPAKQAFKQVNSAASRALLGLSSSLFRGFIPAMTKEAIKNGTYKAPLFKGAPKLIANNPPHNAFTTLPASAQHAMIAFTAASVAAGADTLFGGPFERFATYRATSQAEHQQANFLTELKSQGNWRQQMQFLFKGSAATFIKTGISCFALFAFAGPIQQRIENDFFSDLWDLILLYLK